MKIGLVGAGYVGATTAYALMLQGIASELVLIDVNKDRAEGEALDLIHSTSFVHPVEIYAGDYSDLAGAEIVIISAGPSIGKNETRLDLAGKNYEIFKNIIPRITRHNDSCILLIVTNPVDVLSYAALRLSGFPKNRVIGSGTVLDSSRFRAALAAKLGVDARNIHGYILGEHGDSQVAAWSLTNIMGINFDEFCAKYAGNCGTNIKEEIEKQVRTSAYKVIAKKGATNYAVALAIAKIVKSILRNENSILTVSTYVEDLDGVGDVYLSLPCIVNKHGADRVLIPQLSNNEKADLKKSAEIIKKYIEDVMGAVV
ncbi:MAG: L-lactate dehydrogenase [Thermoanaerobacteraceae bacterium]|jgi:L-lactate dehydrogenase|uniref:L-lactate dehydrogenase n=1 Tax=Biomaibacter acetigenes TaxID=2316383 RepID=A0A3G2R401_9FIRM|nr:L-lactate dehydrogenase [Biomaibacter acetigenes]AYO30081.1 L-lactate dehydrogenase [Biomaibacter acetigenes]MDK2879817.1 L-lactate dehydrogenase [Thermoanaerobacteraceae bacterium]